MAKQMLQWAALGLAMTAGPVWAQAPTSAPAFEVASIKPAPALSPQLIQSGKMHVGMTVDKASVDIGFVSLADLVRIAYDVKPYQVTGPDWIRTERFDIMAKLPDGATEKQVPAMLQSLLAERFKLTIHRDHKDQPIYALVVAKGGPKLKDAAPDPDTPPAAASGQANAAPTMTLPDGRGGQMQMTRTANGMRVSGAGVGNTNISMQDGKIHMEFSKMTMTALTDLLTPMVDRPVIDMTELKGNYQVAIDFAMADMANIAKLAGIGMPGLGGGGGGEPGRAPIDAASDPSGGAIFQAVQQLGLKLDGRKSPLEMIVVDHAERAPTEN
jgi:uncharacterized protein (TIGR03435 family)